MSEQLLLSFTVLNCAISVRTTLEQRDQDESDIYVYAISKCRGKKVKKTK